MRRRAWILALAFAPGVAWAGLNGDLANFYRGLGAMTNVTPAGVYKSQAGGYYTGGGVYVRAPVRTVQLLQVSPPSLRAGCGGIDLYLGGFSFINKQQFIQMLRNIGNNAAGYAFMLALQSISPQIYSTISDMQRILRKANEMSINSCQAAQALVDGIAGKLARSSQTLCQNWARNKGFASDQADAAQFCQNPANVAQLFSGPLTPAERARTVVNKNLLWWGLGRDAYLSTDPELKGMLMALAGTLVVRESNGVPDVHWYPPLMDVKRFVDSVIYGNGKKVEIYFCSMNDPHCLNIQRQTVAVTQPLIQQVKAALDEIRTKLEAEPISAAPLSLTQATKRILVLTDVPALRMMASAVALGPTMAREVENMLAEPIAFGIAAAYLDWAYRSAMRAARESSRYFDPHVLDQFVREVGDRRKELRDLMRTHKVTTAMRLMERARWMDRVVISSLSPSFRAAFEEAGF
ncbi:MAG: hypothetical protein D6771_04475 [Zetaproteobacteria bacterium]|nr:MAG: hypothetical protein D6771_04475 [Zetaproteobacteria bacterium]